MLLDSWKEINKVAIEDLIKWKISTEYEIEIEDINGNVELFLSYLLNEDIVEDVEELSMNMESLLEALIDDIKMAVLCESLGSVEEYIKKVKNRKKIKNEHELLFVMNQQLLRYEKEFLIKNSIIKKADLDILNGVYFSLYNLMPKIAIPWNIYALNKIINKRSNNNSVINKIIDTKELPLFNLHNDKINNILYESIKDINIFWMTIKSILEDEDTFNNVNESLNMFIFNKYTNLIDVYYLYQKSLESVWLQAPFSKSDNSFFNIEEEIQELLPIIHFEGINLKKFLMEDNIFNIDFFRNDRYMGEFVILKENLKNSLKKAIVNHYIENDYTDDPIFYEIKVVKYLSKSNPYLEAIEEFEGLEVPSDKILLFKKVYEKCYQERKKSKVKNVEQVEQVEQREKLKGNNAILITDLLRKR